MGGTGSLTPACRILSIYCRRQGKDGEVRFNAQLAYLSFTYSNSLPSLCITDPSSTLPTGHLHPLSGRQLIECAVTVQLRLSEVWDEVQPMIR